MYTFTPLHLAISNKLGWGGMLAEIALPAIDRMITNYIGHVSDATGDILSVEDAGSVMSGFESDDLFSLIASPYYPEWEYMRNDFIRLRSAIEADMRMGFSYKTAIIAEYIN